MIRVTDLVRYLRTQLPSWRVDGAIEQAVAEDKSRLTLPAMFVGLLPFDAEPMPRGMTYRQEYVEKFFILTCTPVDPNEDRTGKYAQDFVLTARRMLMGVLVNYKDLDGDSNAICIVRDVPDKFDGSRYWHRFEYSVVGVIEPPDVTQLDLDYFDKLFVDWTPTGATDDTPHVEQEIKPIYFVPGE